jgi:hypothetical protein
MNFNIKNKKEIIVIATSVVAFAVSYYLIKNYATKKGRLKHIARKDLRKWKGKTETDPSRSSDLVGYWKLVGKDFSNKQMQQSSTHSSFPWSAVYIDHLIVKAGYKNFNPKTTHSGYVVDAKKNRANKLKDSYWAHKPSELLEVEIGDILIKGRAGTNPNLDTINSGVLTHGDIVVDLATVDGQKYAITQGGNVSNTVKQTKVPLTDNYRLLNPVHFAQLKYEK